MRYGAVDIWHFAPGNTRLSAFCVLAGLCTCEHHLVPADRAADVYQLDVELRSRASMFLQLLFWGVMGAMQAGGGGPTDTYPHVLTLWKGDDIVLRWAFGDRGDCRHSAGRILHDLECLSPERFAAQWLADSTERSH